MSQIPYRANLQSSHFPFLSQFQGRTVIIPGHDDAFQVNALAKNSNDEDRDRGIPQVYYGHNILPTGQGIQSVGFLQRLPGLAGNTSFTDLFVIKDQNENKLLFSPATNNNYVFDGTLGVWTAQAIIPDISSSSLVTVAYLNGITYVFFQGIGCYKYDTATKAFIAVTLTLPVTLVSINGITSANGFLIAWDDFNVYRSQATNPVDFTPDPTLGSGFSIPDDIKGQIVVCLPIIGGFIIYTTKNAVGASFSQNIRYPFIYKEIKGSAGIQQANHVSWQDNTGEHYAWTQAGLQQINKLTATVIHPEATDFLTSSIFEDYDTTTNTFTVTLLTSPLILRLAVIGRRYLAISYGVTQYTHILVFDLIFKRWGKLKITHAAAFELFLPNIYGMVIWTDLKNTNWQDLGVTTWADLLTGINTFERPKEIFAILSLDGTVQTVNFELSQTGDNSVLILGKYQYIRSRFLILDGVEIENIQVANAITITDLPSIDGKNYIDPNPLYLSLNQGLARDYQCNIEALNHTIVMAGTFHASSLLLNFHTGGRE